MLTVGVGYDNNFHWKVGKATPLSRVGNLKKLAHELEGKTHGIITRKIQKVYIKP
jgi:hypothetical protein